MKRLDIITYSFLGKEYKAANIPDVILWSNNRLLIGQQSLNLALYNDDNGYVEDMAKTIDEQIYAYIEDEYFTLNYDEFIEKVKMYLD